jgi:hypothetical protein
VTNWGSIQPCEGLTTPEPAWVLVPRHMWVDAKAPSRAGEVLLPRGGLELSALFGLRFPIFCHKLNSRTMNSIEFVSDDASDLIQALWPPSIASITSGRFSTGTGKANSAMTHIATTTGDSGISLHHTAKETTQQHHHPAPSSGWLRISPMARHGGK